MIEPGCGVQRMATWLFVLVSFVFCQPAGARSRVPSPPPVASPTAAPAKKLTRQDDSVSAKPAKDLQLRLENEHKADALAHFVEGMSFEENGEMDKALASYRKVLDVDPGQPELAGRVASLLARQDDFPQAIDVLKDAIKATPNASVPF